MFSGQASVSAQAVVVSKPTFSGQASVAAQAVVVSKPTFSEQAVVVENSKQYIQSNTISIIATSDGSNIQTGEKDLSKDVDLPTFVATPSVTVMDPSEYDANRAQLREDAINEILDMIK